MTTKTEKPESYEQTRERQAREEIATQSAFVDKVKALNLPGWTFEAHAGHRGAYIRHAETGASIYFTATAWARNGKIEASGRWPKGPDGSTFSASQWGACDWETDAKYCIGFAHAKSSKAISRDLLKRLIPQVLTAQVYINGKIAENDASAALIGLHAARISDVLPNVDLDKCTHYSAALRFDRGSASIGLSNKYDKTDLVSIDLKLEDLTTEQVIEIAAILRRG